MAKAEADCITACYGLTATVEEKKSGWHEEDGGWRFYLGNPGECVAGIWYPDGDKLYWFNGAGCCVDTA